MLADQIRVVGLPLECRRAVVRVHMVHAIREQRAVVWLVDHERVFARDGERLVHKGHLFGAIDAIGVLLVDFRKLPVHRVVGRLDIGSKGGHANRRVGRQREQHDQHRRDGLRIACNEAARLHKPGHERGASARDVGEAQRRHRHEEDAQAGRRAIGERVPQAHEDGEPGLRRVARNEVAERHVGDRNEKPPHAPPDAADKAHNRHDENGVLDAVDGERESEQALQAEPESVVLDMAVAHNAMQDGRRDAEGPEHRNRGKVDKNRDRPRAVVILRACARVLPNVVPAVCRQENEGGEQGVRVGDRHRHEGYEREDDKARQQGANEPLFGKADDDRHEGHHHGVSQHVRERGALDGEYPGVGGEGDGRKCAESDDGALFAKEGAHEKMHAGGEHDCRHHEDERVARDGHLRACHQRDQGHKGMPGGGVEARAGSRGHRNLAGERGGVALMVQRAPLA